MAWGTDDASPRKCPACVRDPLPAGSPSVPIHQPLACCGDPAQLVSYSSYFLSNSLVRLQLREAKREVIRTPAGEVAVPLRLQRPLGPWM